MEKNVLLTPRHCDIFWKISFLQVCVSSTTNIFYDM